MKIFKLLTVVGLAALLGSCGIGKGNFNKQKFTGLSKIKPAVEKDDQIAETNETIEYYQEAEETESAEVVVESEYSTFSTEEYYSEEELSTAEYYSDESDKPSSPREKRRKFSEESSSEMADGDSRPLNITDDETEKTPISDWSEDRLFKNMLWYFLLCPFVIGAGFLCLFLSWPVGLILAVVLWVIAAAIYIYSFYCSVLLYKSIMATPREDREHNTGVRRYVIVEVWVRFILGIIAGAIFGVFGLASAF